MTLTAPNNINGLAFTNVNAGSTATAEVPTDAVYLSLTLVHKHGASPAVATEAELKANIEEIRLKIDGKVQQVYSADQLIMLHKFHGDTIVDGYLELPFARKHLHSTAGQDLTVWGTADVANFHVEVDIASGVVNPSLELRYEKLNFNRPMGDIIKIRRQVLGVTSTGLRNETNLPKNDKYVQMHLLMGGASDISNVEISLDQRTVYEKTAADTSAHLKKWGFVEQSNVFHIPFDYRSRQFEFLDPWVLNGKGQRVAPHASFQFDVTMAAANDFTMLQYLIGPRD